MNNKIERPPAGLEAIKGDVDTKDIFALDVREEITRSSFVPEEEIDKISGIRNTIDEQMKALTLERSAN